MRTRETSAFTIFADAAGIIAWFAAAFFFYREETVVTTIDGIANYQRMHVQMEIMVLACALAIVGTVFLSSAAIVKAIGRATLTSPGN